MQQVSHRTNVLRAYRQLLHLIKRLPAAQQSQALTQARTEAAVDRQLVSSVEASDTLKQLYARIGYLRTITPRRPGDAERIGAGRYVLRDGELVPSDLRPDSRVADGKITMEEAWTRHNSLLRRQHFGRTPGPPEPM